MTTELQTVDDGEDNDPESGLALRESEEGGGINPFGPSRGNGALAGVEESRAITEVKAAIFMARECPRDERGAMDRILKACEQQVLAEKAMYAYPKGGTMVTGESIRLAEALRLCWGNLDAGWRELSEDAEKAIVQTWAWDLESNSRESLSFSVRFIRNTKRGSYPLTDERERYELKANMAARRKRACILAMIPSYVRENAIKRCELTLKRSINITPELVQTLLDKFAEFGVTKKMLEARIQRTFDATPGKDPKTNKPIITFALWPAHVIQLRKIYNSLKDGMATADQFFEPESALTTGVVGAVVPIQTKADGVRAQAAKMSGKVVVDTQTGEATPMAPEARTDAPKEADAPKVAEQTVDALVEAHGAQAEGLLLSAAADPEPTYSQVVNADPEQEVEDESHYPVEAVDDDENPGKTPAGKSAWAILIATAREVNLIPTDSYKEFGRAVMRDAGANELNFALAGEARKKIIAEAKRQAAKRK